MKTRRRRIGRGVNAKGRSISGDQYAAFTYVMLNSAAWRSLGGAAVKVFLELRTRFHGGNNGELVLSFDQAAALLGLSKSTVKRATEELEEKGFIVRTRQGQWYGRLASTWAVTDKGVKNSPATNAWRQWRAPHATVPIRHAKTENGTEEAP